MRGLATVILVALGAGSDAAAGARAGTTAEVIASDPAGDEVTLGRNQNFYLRIRYTSDQPTGIWVQPYFHGKPVAAGTNPSGTYTGSGEALGWFFLMRPGDEVDEVRINAGDGSREGTQRVATHRVHVVGGSRPAEARTPPAWVVEMKQKNEVAAREAYEKSASTPPTPGDVALFGGFMLAMLGLGLVGIAAPAWGMWRWDGGWRLAAAVPAVMMVFVALRILLDTARDPTSHNLWPFEILQSGGLSVVVMAALLVMRKLAGAAR
jgi:hypothetical protein